MPDRPAESPGEKRTDITRQGENPTTAPPAIQRHRTVLLWVMAASALVVFSLLSFLVETRPSFPIDLRITLAIQSIHSPFFEGLMRVISWPGFSPQSILITLLVAFTFYIYRLRWESVTAILGAFLSGVINELVKGLIARPRPLAEVVDVFAVLDSYSFPSGHVMFYITLFGFVWYVIFTVLKRSLLRNLLLGLLGAFILLVGVSRIYLGQHWASDVLGAYLLGGLVLAATILFYQWGKKRFFVHRSHSPFGVSKN
jgi:membrane-associated phospholipid phosphatase